MADPLSINGTVASVTAIAAEVSMEIHSFVSDVKHSPKGIEDISAELSSLCSVLGQLDSTLKHDFNTKSPFSSELTKDLCDVLDNCKNVFERIRTLMQKYEKESTWTRVQSFFVQNDVVQIQRSLEAHKQTLTVTLMLMVNLSTKRISDNTSETRALIEGLIEKFKIQKIKADQDIDEESNRVINQYLSRTESTIIDSEPPQIETSQVSLYYLTHSENPSETQPGTDIVDEAAKDFGKSSSGKESSDSTLGSQSEMPSAGPLEAETGGASEAIMKPIESSDNQPTGQSDDQGDTSTKELALPSGSEANLPSSNATAPQPPKRATKVASEQSGKALVKAAESSNLKMVSLMLDFVADIDAEVLFYGATYGNALKAAVANDHTDVVKALLKAGANPSIGRVLRLAVEKGNETIVQHLLDNRADPNVAFLFEGTPLSTAVVNGNTAMVNQLLDGGADPSALAERIGTPLKAAVRASNSDIAEILLRRGADPNCAQGFEGTALSIAVQNNNEAMVNLLLDGGADVNAWAGRAVDSALRVAIAARNKDMVDILLRRGANPSIAYVAQLAAQNDDEVMMQRLLDNGVDINISHMWEGTPLSIAAAKGNTAMAKQLLDAGADPNVGTERAEPPLIAALNAGHVDVVELGTACWGGSP